MNVVSGFGHDAQYVHQLFLVGFGTSDRLDLSAFNLVNNTRYTASLALNTSANNIELHLTGAGPLALTWYGHNTQTWDTKSHSPWNTDSQMFYEMDSVSFGNSAYTPALCR